MQSAPVRLELGDIDFTRINLDYRNDAENMDASIRLGNFHTKADSIDLALLHFRLKQITLNKTMVAVRFGKRVPVKAAREKVTADTISHAGAWSVDIAAFTIDSTRLQYDDDNKQAVRKGMDYNHLLVNHLGVHASGLHADPSAYRAAIAGISFDEKSGLVLQNLSTQAEYNAKGASLKNLVIKTNRSEIRNQTAISFRSTDDLKKHPGDIGVNLLFDHARIAVKDVLLFVPSLEGSLNENQLASLRLNGKLSGRVKDMQIPYLEIGGVGNTELAASGTIKGLPDAKKAHFDITISKLTTSKKDLEILIPTKSLPENLRLPDKLSATGKFTGTVNRFTVALHTQTSSGSADITGSLDLDRKEYDLVADTRLLDLGYILKQDSLMGKITLDATAKGSGFDPKKMNSIFHVHVGAADFKSYKYQGLILDANLQNGNGTVSVFDAGSQPDLPAEGRSRFPE